jgi:type I restriction enzyme S subunit
MRKSREKLPLNEERYPLPEGWEWKTLGEICEKPQYGWTTSANFKKKGFKLLRTTDISSGIINWDSVPFCEDEPDEPQKYLLHKGDILVARAGSVGISIEIEDRPKAIFGSYLIRFRPKPPLSSRIISLYLKSPYYWGAIADNTAGIAIPNVNATKLSALQIPLPPTDQQETFVKKVEHFLEQVSKTKQSLAQIPPILKKFRQSVLAKAFSGELTKEWREQQKSLEPASKLLERIREERRKKLGKRYKEPEPIATSDLPELPEGWEWVSLEMMADIIMGQSPPSSTYNKDGKGLPFFQGKAEFGDFYPTPVKWCKSPKKIAEEGDILISIRAPVGPTNLAGQKCCIGRGLGVIRPLVEMPSKLILYYLRYIEDKLSKEGQGSTFTAISRDDLVCIRFPLPPLREQYYVVKKTEEFFDQADTIEKSVKIAQAHCEKLTQSILAKAFRGELVEQDPNDEPAEMLLKRISRKI